MRRILPLLVLLAAVAAPISALAGTVDPTLIPDGTYTAKVEKVLDSKHVEIMMVDNGMVTTVTTDRPQFVDFGKVKPNELIKLTLIKGMVRVYGPA